MEYKLPESKIDKAKRLVLAEYQYPGETEKVLISLYDLYMRENIQGKIRFHQLDWTFIESELQKRVGFLSMEWWVNKHSGLSADEIGQLKLLLRDKLAKRKLLAKKGLKVGLHDSNPALDEAYKQVTQKEIDDYYQSHKEDFKKIDYVEVRHIRLPDQKTAKKVQKKLMFGMDFDEAVKAYSIADDKNHERPGYLGKIVNEGKKTWTKSVVFVLKPGKPGRPIRSPDMNGHVYWEIFLVDKRVEGYYPSDSDTVRYLAGKEVALKKLESDFFKLRKRLFDKAEIGMNNRALASINYN